MGNIGWSEILIIAVVIVFLFGPERLPRFLKKFRELRSMLLKLRDEAMETVEPIERELNQKLLEEKKPEKEAVAPRKPSDYRSTDDTDT